MDSPDKSELLISLYAAQTIAEKYNKGIAGHLIEIAILDVIEYQIDCAPIPNDIKCVAEVLRVI